MSDGTQDQLSLSLRLASIEKYLKDAEPMPLVVDDTLVNFDDERSRGTLQVLADLSKHTQVIFFTHHKSLVELAKEEIPVRDLAIYNLEGLALKNKQSGEDSIYEVMDQLHEGPIRFYRGNVG